MKTAAVIGLMFATVASAAPQNSNRSRTISVTFSVDGKRAPCDDLKIQLSLDGRILVPKCLQHGFIVPSAFSKKSSEWLPDQRVDVSLSCGEHAFSFRGLHPGWVSPGSWEVGIAYPPYWTERFGWTGAVETGRWLSYLESECDGCDPGIFTTVSHPTPPPALVASLSHEQPTATGERARDIAYALAVFDSEYQRNRNYLLEKLNSCLSRPKDSPEDDVCDSRLFEYVTNLYWRGDETLLGQLLKLADSRRDVIGEIGTFYSNLLERHTADVVHGMQGLPIDTQLMVCGLAGRDDLAMDGPKLQRVANKLKATNNEVADRCLLEAERTSK